jgi:hypothetical protein
MLSDPELGPAMHASNAVSIRVRQLVFGSIPRIIAATGDRCALHRSSHR